MINLTVSIYLDIYAKKFNTVLALVWVELDPVKEIFGQMCCAVRLFQVVLALFRF